MSTSKNIRYIPAVDHLRAYAALLVLLYHSALVFVPIDFARWPKTSNPFMAVVYEGHSGVALFLVLSGFIFTYGSAGRDIDYKTFLLNRVLRIYPLMIALMFIGVSAYGDRLDTTQVIETLLPVQNLHGIVANTPLGAYNQLFWTISVEFQFYLIFPFLHKQLLRRGILGLIPLMVFLLLARWSAYLLGANVRDLCYWTIVGRLDQFLVGMIAATVASRLTFEARWLRWALPVGIAGIVAALCLFNQGGGWPNTSGWRIFWPPVEAALWAMVILGYLTIAHGRHGRVSKVLAALGTISYSMYLIHPTVVDLLTNYGLAFHLPRSPFLSALLTGFVCVIPLTVLVSTLTYHAIEKPFLELRRRYLAPERNTPLPAAEPAPPTALHAPALAVEDRTQAEALGKRWLIAGSVGVGALIVTAIGLGSHLGAHDVYDPITNSSMHLNIEQAIAASNAGSSSGCKVLIVPDEAGAVAVDVGLQLAHAGVPFVVQAGRWLNTFGAQHQWKSLDAAALKGGLFPWYIVPRGTHPPGVPANAPAFRLRDAGLILLPPTLNLSAVGSTADIKFTAGGNAADYALGGWSNMDPGGTWTGEKWVALAFHPQMVEGTQIELFFDGQPFLAPEHGVTRQRLRLFFNGTPIEPEQQLTEPGSVPFIIPAATWNAAAAKMDAAASLAFELPDAVSPASFGPPAHSDDARKLGVFVSRLRFQVAP